MARVAVVLGDGTLPPSFELLTHSFREVPASQVGLGEVDDDLLLVDGRTELGQARELCRTLALGVAAPPVVLLVSSPALAVLAPDWGMADFVLAEASPGEVEARLRMAMRTEQASGRIECGPLVVDESAYTASVGGHALELTYTEFELLKYLAMHPGRVLTRETLLSEVWGYDYYGGTRTVDVHIRRLRAKLGPEYDGHITTVRNVGYRFAPTK